MTSKKERKEIKMYVIIERRRRKFHKNWRAKNYCAHGNIRLLMLNKAFELIPN